MSKLKAPLIIAGATCLLSMLIGLVSGVQFITMLGRGLISGMGAGGFVFLARVLLERFIPDLFTPQPQPETAEIADPTSGTNVNITLDDDAALPIAGKTIKTARNKAADSNTSHTESDSSASSGNDDTEPAENTSDTVKQPSSAAKEAGFSAADTFPTDGDADNNGELSDLPDMGAFMDSADDIDSGTGEGITGSPSGFSVEGIQTGGGDSKLMAHAIRTVLATED